MSGREDYLVSRIFITGSTDGLGRFAAGALMGDGHEVVLHARTRERASALSGLAPDAAQGPARILRRGRLPRRLDVLAGR